MRDINNLEVLKIKEAVTRAKINGMPVSEYTVRRAIQLGQLPCRIVGRTYLITWTNFVNWITCADNAGSTAASKQGPDIRK